MHKKPALKLALTSLLLGLAAGCAPLPASGPGRVAPDADQGQILTGTDGKCYGRQITPAVIETVTEQIVVQPAVLNTDGSVRSPAAFRTVTRQRILTERREVEFEAVCASVLTPEFIASLQRALEARGGYSGPVTGAWDARTARAVQAWQTARGGPSSPVLAIATARDLGLVSLPRDQL